MRGLCGFLLIGAAAYLLYTAHKKSQAALATPKGGITLKTPLEPGVQLTGRVERTNNTQKPGSTTDISAFGIKDWMEVIYPDGTKDWVEASLGKWNPGANLSGWN